jgi:ATP-dependent DNA helicase RecQ
MVGEVETSEILDTLKSFFGFDGFKGNQEKIIKNLLNGKDTFVIMPPTP